MKNAKGRPVSGEEFDQMLAAAEAWLPAECVNAWLCFLRGLW